MAELAAQIEAFFHFHFNQRQPPRTPVSERKFKIWCNKNARRSEVPDDVRDPSTAEDDFERQILHRMVLQRDEKIRKGRVSLKRFHKLPNELKLSILELTLTKDEVTAGLATYAEQRGFWRILCRTARTSLPDWLVYDGLLIDLRFDGVARTIWQDINLDRSRFWCEKIREVSGLRPVAETMKKTWLKWIDEWCHEYAVRCGRDCPIGHCAEHSAVWARIFRANGFHDWIKADPWFVFLFLL